MKLLSISNPIHDFNISYFDGKRVHYLKSERLLQIKHHGDRNWVRDASFLPKILKENFDISIKDVDAICFDFIFAKSIDPLKYNNYVFKDEQYVQYNEKTYFVNHHYLHALSCNIFNNDYDVYAVVDGQGGRYSWTFFKNDKLVDYGLIDKNGSFGFGMVALGRQAEIQGHFLDVAGKLMALQSYGTIDYDFKKKLKYDYNVLGGIVDDNISLERNVLLDKSFIPGLFDVKKYDGNLLDGIATIHDKAGDILCDLFEKNVNVSDRIAYSGGVAQNIIWNTRLKNKYANLDILPHCSDEGLSIGGLEFLRRMYNLPKFDYSNYPYMQLDEAPIAASDETIEQIAKHLASGKVVAWYQGHSEIGPRALGNRSILMDPRLTNGKDKMNSIKNREEYRPFGASVLSEYAKEYFDLDFPNPYMLYVGIAQKYDLKSITHIDGTCRAQTVSESDNSQFRKLLKKFHNITGCPVLLNTSLNVSGKPIAAHFKDAIYEFENTDIDILVIGDKVYNK